MHSLTIPALAGFSILLSLPLLVFSSLGDNLMFN
ncbi:unnamed protein product, partial [Vitis vinifera]|uniref:Uncharacterized protein n=1 Tax=Vitis vinifera TaxID=29760 RepID=E0CPJ6_VITVI